MELMIFLIVGAVTSLIEVPSLLKEKRLKDLLVFAVFMGVSLVLVVLATSNIPLPSPAKLLTTIIRQFVNVKFGYQ